jgi:hypothetical protein
MTRKALAILSNHDSKAGASAISYQLAKRKRPPRPAGKIGRRRGFYSPRKLLFTTKKKGTCRFEEPALTDGNCWLGNDVVGFKFPEKTFSDPAINKKFRKNQNFFLFSNFNLFFLKILKY